MVFSSKYAWSGRTFSVSADTVGAVLEDIEQKNGSVSKELFLDASRSEDSPTHKMFEWDDKIAGEKWRLNQAHKIINSLHLNIQQSETEEKQLDLSLDHKPMMIPAFVSVVPQKDNAQTVRARYVNVAAGMSDPESRSIILQNAMRLLRVFKNKYSAYEEFSQIISDINDLEVQIPLEDFEEEEE